MNSPGATKKGPQWSVVSRGLGHFRPYRKQVVLGAFHAMERAARA